MTDFLTIQNDTLKAQISPWGAALARLWIVGHDTSLVLGLPQADDYQNAPDYSGVIVGPIAGRVSAAKAIVNGTTWDMDANTPPDCLHSGSSGSSFQKWQVTAHTATSITLVLDLPHGMCGLPGNRRLMATYSIDANALLVEIDSTTDQDTPINATLHAYWSLDDAGDLSTHRLKVPTTHMCATGPDLIPTGEIVSQAGKDHDFTAPKSPVTTAPLDGCFCLQTPAPDTLQDVMWLRSDTSNIELTVASNQPGLVLYTGEYLTPETPPAYTPRSAPFSALAIEAQGYPDAVNNGNFPSILVKKNAIKRQVTCFTLQRP